MAAKMKVAGTWAGVLEVKLEHWTVPMLREEIAKRSNCGPESINLISSGRVLRDGDGTQKLSELGLKNNAKVLVSRVNLNESKSFQEQSKAEKQRLKDEEQRTYRFNRLKAAASALAERHLDVSVPLEDCTIELQDQNGQKISMGTETDERAIMMGFMFHAQGKLLIESQEYKDALEVFTLGEEAFSLCDPKLIDLVDTVSILQIDMVWCYFMLRDISLLSVAGERLTKARKGIELALGKDASRVRLLQDGSSPELALYLRLELLEGIVAYYGGELEKSRQLLTSAQTKLSKLQVSDEALSLLVSMGFEDYEIKRALRMNRQDVAGAITFLERERDRKTKQYAEDLQQQEEIMEQKVYPQGKAVDIQRLNELVSMGFEREVAAEALQRNENGDLNLTNGDLNSRMQVGVETRKRKREDTTRAQNASEDHDMEMEEQLAHDLEEADALSDYDIDVSIEAEAITEYVALLDSCCSSAQPFNPQ
ncbi:hypothetical protein Dimus_034306 [Dionaea muscipula]